MSYWAPRAGWVSDKIPAVFTSQAAGFTLNDNDNDKE